MKVRVLFVDGAGSQIVSHVFENGKKEYFLLYKRHLGYGRYQELRKADVRQIMITVDDLKRVHGVPKRIMYAYNSLKENGHHVEFPALKIRS